MARRHQDFEKLRMKNNFYVDKTGFIQEWWESDDDVTLITRPRRFGKTLNSSSNVFISVSLLWEESDYTAGRV